MNRETDNRLIKSGNAVDVNALAAYAYDRSQEDTDTIDFSSDIDKSGVVTLDSSSELSKVQSGVSDSVAPPEESETDSVAPIKHQESTLLVDSPLLQLKEELDGEIPSKHGASHHHLVLLFVVIGVCVAFIGVFLSIHLASDNDEENSVIGENNPIDQAVDAAKRNPIEYRMVSIEGEPQNVDYVVNGVALSALVPNPSERIGLQLIDHESNTVVVYGDGYVPYMIPVEKDRDYIENPLTYQLQSGETYQKSTLILRAPKGSNLAETIIYINGRPSLAKAEQRVEVISGFPVFIQVRERSKGDHLHIVWPTRNEESVQLPELEPLEGANRVTVFNINVPKDYTRDKSFNLVVTAENQSTTVAGTRRIAKNEMVEIKMNKNGRYPFQMILDTTPFGSIYVDAYMQLSSRGIGKVRFHKKSLNGVTLCFRRSSETVCTNAEGETIVPSGRWELVAYREAGATKQWFTNSSYETISEDMEYVFTIKSKGKIFSYEMVKSKLSE